MNIPEFNEIVEQNDQTEARREHLEKLRELVGNVYPNKFERSKISGTEDTISNILGFEPVAEIDEEIKKHISTLNEGEKPAPELKEILNAKLKEFGNVKVSGRLTTTPRTMGKAAFVHLSDGVNRLQIYVRRDDLQGIHNGSLNNENPKSENQAAESVSGWDLFKLLDGGDFVGVGGFLFLTNTGELSIHVETLQFLSKALLPMPDKMHGIADAEINRRYRYADLIASSLRIKTDEEVEEEKRIGIKKLTTREVFERRAKLISGMRRFLDDNDFIEVETPMLTPKATGAAAKPFATHHNALDITLYARIAPELYLKRLTVGGFEKVYELNRNFRNEGLSHKHNPEFTMLEFYCAYMDVNGMMDFAEAMIKESVQKATGGSLIIKLTRETLVYELFGVESPEKFFEIDFSKPFRRLSMVEAICENWNDSVISEASKVFNVGQVTPEWLADANNFELFYIITEKFLGSDVFTTRHFLSRKLLSLTDTEKSELSKRIDELKNDYSFQQIIKPRPVIRKETEIARATEHLFEKIAENNLIQPTFIIDYPKSISPLSKASPENPQIAERFELFINGMECANGFSELNDPQEQYERFADQMRERETGDEEAMVLDEDYIRALAYGMPPAAGIGIGIDRLVMLLTNKHSIRDVILFPHMRPEKNKNAEESENTGEN